MINETPFLTPDPSFCVIRKGHPLAILIMISLIALTFVTLASFDHHYSALAVLGPKKVKHATPFILPMPFP